MSPQALGKFLRFFILSLLFSFYSKNKLTTVVAGHFHSNSAVFFLVFPTYSPKSKDNKFSVSCAIKRSSNLDLFGNCRQEMQFSLKQTDCNGNLLLRVCFLSIIMIIAPPTFVGLIQRGGEKIQLSK